MKRPLLALAALAGCVDASRPATRAAARAVVQERARDEAADRARRAALLPVPVVQRERARVVAREGGIAHVVAGPLRYDLHAGGVSPAEDVPPEPIAHAARGARGWVFVAGAAVYASETFTGRLRLLRSFGGEPSAAEAAGHRDPAVALAPSAGRVALSVAGQGAFVSDGATLEALGAPGAVESAWRDASHGAAIVARGALRVTSDGGGTWRDVDTGGETPAVLEARGDAILVATEGGTRRLDERALALAPAAPPEATCEPEPATAPPFDRGYARLPPPPAEPCERPAARARVVWEGPAFDVALAGARRNETNGYGEATWSFRPARAAPFGPLWARALVDTARAPVVARTTTQATARGYAGGLAWRGRDEAGPFQGAARARQPPEVPPYTRWELAAATRRGALVVLDALPAGHAYREDRDEDASVVPTFFWATAAGLRRVPAGPGGAGDVWGAVPTEDGGAVALGATTAIFPDSCDALHRGLRGREVTHALLLGPDGAVRGTRVVAEGAGSRAVGVGQRGARWGLAVAERDAFDGLRWLPFGGGTWEDFGAWRLDTTPRACGAPEGEVTRLHLLFSSGQADEHIFLGARDVVPDEPLASVRHVVLERGASGVCVRRIAGVHHAGDFEVSPENSHAAHGALILDANAGRLSGIWDDGARIATVTAALAPPPPPPPPR